MNEEQLDNHIVRWKSYKNGGFDVPPMTPADDIIEAFEAARERNELQANIATQRKVYEASEAERLKLQAERDALKKENANLQEDIKVMHHEVAVENCYRHSYDQTVAIEKENDTLRANNAALREIVEQALPAWGALLSYMPNIQQAKKYQAAEDAFKATPADSLTEYRNGVLEEAAQVADDEDGEMCVVWGEYRNVAVAQETAQKIADAIRAMRTGQ